MRFLNSFFYLVLFSRKIVPGRSDGESVSKLIQQVKPRRVIIVRGSQPSCDSLAKIATNVTNETGIGKF